jgi:hypothetical protein
MAINCTSYNNAKDGFYSQSTNGTAHLINCLSTKSGGYNFNSNANTAGLIMQSCAGWVSGGSGNINTGTSAPFLNENFVTLGADPFISAATGNFGLTAAAIALLAGIPGSFSGLPNTTGYLFIGAVQPPVALAGEQSNMMVISGGADWTVPVWTG